MNNTMQNINNPAASENPLSVAADQIVENRRTQAKQFITKRQQLKSISETVDSLIEISCSKIWADIMSQNQEREKLWSTISPELIQLRDNLSNALTEGAFNSAYSRATRTYVNIGAVGIKREGKSSFIRNATSLDEWLIPNRGGDDPCTTAPINIINGELLDSKGAKVSNVARVHYYSVPELCEYLNLYIQELGGADKYHIGTEVKTREKFKQICLELHPNCNKDPHFGNGDIENKKTFLKYLQHAPNYADSLLEYEYDNEGNIKRDENGMPVTTAESYIDYKIEDILLKGETGQKYYSSVSYYTSPGSSEEVYSSFATKFAEIATSFNIGNSPVYNIQFLDTPGIGESKAGIEQTMSDAITAKLDAVIVVAAVGNSKSDGDKNKLVNLLRVKLTEKSNVANWLFYALNIFQDNVNPESIKKAKDNIIESLTIAQDSNPIHLKDSHFRYMDLKNRCGLNEKKKVTSQDPVNPFVLEILTELIPNITNIDLGFFRDGKAQYNAIIEKWKDLKANLEALSAILPSTDTSIKVEKIIEELGKALASKVEWNNILETTIKPNLEPFKQETPGKYVLKVLEMDGANTDFNDRSHDNLVAFCTANIKHLNQYSFRESHYNQNISFMDYTSRKIALQTELIDAVGKLIKEEEAITLLNQFKNSLREVFLKEGRLEFIESDVAFWWRSVADYMKKQQVCPKLEKRFRDIANLSIRAKEQLSGTITKTIQESLWHDDFGGKNQGFRFNEYIEALTSFVRSLLVLEQYSKDLIEIEVFDKEIKNIQNNITTTLDRISEICNSTDSIENAETRNELRAFYNMHLDEVLKNDSTAAISAVVSRWRETIKLSL